MARRPDAFQTIRTEGGILPSSVLQSIAALKANHLDAASFHLPDGERIQEAIERSWARMLAMWSTFRKALETDTSESATSLTRERWLLPLFHELSFGRLPPAPGFTVEGRGYPISHGWGQVPIHLIGAKVDLDKRTRGVTGAATASPHGLVQDFLNKSDDHLWGIVSNGLTLRLLRDHASLTRQAFVEFDLEEMFEGQARTDFAVLWLVLHQSRFEGARPEESIVEGWSQEGSKTGIRALDDLRKQVQEAITALGLGFLATPGNGALRDSLKTPGAAQDFYRELLRLVYRLIFLFVAEDRDLLHPPETDRASRERYARWYSTRRMRDLSRAIRGTRHVDLWRQFRVLSDSLRETGNPSLGLPALGGFLWSEEACRRLQVSDLENGAFLEAVRRLSFVHEGRTLMPIDWRNLGAEELGSIYESLLELHPLIHGEAARFELLSAAGNERKTTGSYYTPSSLIQCLLDSTLMPVLDEAANASEPEKAILSLKVCDPACGSGHFLVAAAIRIADRLASVRTGDDEPSPAATRRALRDVVGQCIYGVDANPMAVELCKVSLWMEAVQPGLPLTFLNSHIQHGNALLGTTPDLMANGIPDAAWDSIEGDDPAAARELKKQNKEEGAGQRMFEFRNSSPSDVDAQAVMHAVTQLDAANDTSVEALARKEEQWDGILQSPAYRHQRFVADAWCAAFLWPKQSGDLAEAAPTNGLWRRIRDGQVKASALTATTVNTLAEQYRFFHWHLQFPQVFAKGGFDVVLGNPPWDSLVFRDEEFFAGPRPDIVKASTAAARKKLIAKLEADEPALFAAYRAGLRAVDGTNAFVRSGLRYPLCGIGRVNLFALFAEAARSLVSKRGRVGQILPSGIVSDDSTKLFFQDVVAKRQLVSFFDFENREGIFDTVHRSFKFGIFTLAGVRPPDTEAEFVFFATRVDQVKSSERRFTLSTEDIALLNPTTKTCPIFRSRKDAVLTKEIYLKVPVLAASGWDLSLRRLLNSADDSDKFQVSYLDGALPLYEGKYFHHYEHRWATTEDGTERALTEAERSDALCGIRPRYWYPADDAYRRFGKTWHHSWTLAWRDIARSTDERSFIATVVPSLAVPHTAKVMFPTAARITALPGLIANLGSFVLDFVARQKLGGTHMSTFIVEQLPVLSPSCYEMETAWHYGTPLREWLLPRVLELTFTAWDLEHFARAIGYEGPPFKWNGERRRELRAEIDAAFFRLYGLSKDDVAHVMESFPIVCRNETKAYDVYRTKQDILAIYDELLEAEREGMPYQTRLVPPPADMSMAHPSRGVGLPAMPSIIPRLQPSEEAAIVIWALLYAAGGTLARTELARAFALRARPELLEQLAPTWLVEASQWATKVGSRAVAQGLLAGTLKNLAERGGIAIGTDGDSRSTVTATQNAPPEHRIDPWFRFEAQIALQVLRAQQPNAFEAIDDCLAGDDRKLLDKPRKVS